MFRGGHNKTKWAILISILVLPIMLVGGFFLADYHRASVNSDTSAIPQASELRPYLDKSNATILHTYSRSVGGFMSTVSLPSYEYYLEYPDTNIDVHSDEILKYLSEIGYETKKALYTQDNYCSPHGYDISSRKNANGKLTTDDEERQYCKEKLGYDTPELFGWTTNDSQPYWVIYGEQGDHTVYVQITDKTFDVTSNDFWGQEYIEQNGFLNDTRVREGKSVATITFGRKGD